MRRMKPFQQEKGITLVELLMASLIMAIMFLFISQFLLNSFNNNLFIQATSDLGNYSQQTVNYLRLNISQSRKIMDNTAKGLSYWQSLDFKDSSIPLEDSKLPEIIPHGSLSPSNEENYNQPFVRDAIGNVLFYVEHLPSLEDKEHNRLIDLYRFVVYFLVKKNDARFSEKKPYYLDLMQCKSAPYADYFQVQSLKHEQIRDDILALLLDSKVVALWDYQVNAEVAFTKIRGFEPGDEPLTRHLIQLTQCNSAIQGMGSVDRPAGRITYSVAFNRNKDFPIRFSVPQYAIADVSKPAFPSGFEVMIVGPKSGRQILIHLVLAAPLYKRIISRESSVIATAKDL